MTARNSNDHTPELPIRKCRDVIHAEMFRHITVRDLDLHIRGSWPDPLSSVSYVAVSIGSD
jgi:hypothetical protein